MPTTANQIEGWMTDEELAWLSDMAGRMSSIIEVGCFKGRSTFALASACRGQVYAVDHWLGTNGVPPGGAAVFKAFIDNVGHFPNLRIVMKPSLEAANDFVDVDMVFLDGDHSYDAVVADIRAWMPKAKRLLCGHDYDDREVKRAVNDIFGPLPSVGTIWYIKNSSV